MPTTDPTVVDAGRTTRAQRAELPLSAELAQVLAEQHGVCIRPLAMRRPMLAALCSVAAVWGPAQGGSALPEPGTL